MAHLVFITLAALLGYATGTSMSTQDFGEGTVIFGHYNKVAETSLNLKAGSTTKLLVVYRNNRIRLDSRVGGQWISPADPEQFRIGSTIKELTCVVEARDSGYDVYMNGKHYYYQDPQSNVKTVRQIEFRASPSIVHQLSFGKVLKHLSVGRVIYIKATAPSNGDFKIELLPTLPREMTCKWQKVSLVLHSKFSATPPAVTRNTYGATCSGGLVGETSGGMPFVAGQAFEVMIVAQQFGFEIGVNGSHFASYEYHSPLPRHGTVMLTNVPAVEKIEYY